MRVEIKSFFAPIKDFTSKAAAVLRMCSLKRRAPRRQARREPVAAVAQTRRGARGRLLAEADVAEAMRKRLSNLWFL